MCPLPRNKRKFYKKNTSIQKIRTFILRWVDESIFRFQGESFFYFLAESLHPPCGILAKNALFRQQTARIPEQVRKKMLETQEFYKNETIES